MITSDLSVPRRLVVLGAIALAGLALTGCGGSSSTTTKTTVTTTPTNATSEPVTTATTTTPSSGHMTAQQVADKLAPLGCSAKAATPTTREEVGGITAVAELKCAVNGNDVEIQEYRNAQEVEHNLNLAKTLGCSINKQLGIKDVYFARGENWYVESKGNSEATANAIKNAVGGNTKVAAVHC